LSGTGLRPFVSGKGRRASLSATDLSSLHCNLTGLSSKFLSLRRPGHGPRFCLYVYYTDAEREWAYDRESHIGRLDTGLDEANAKGWTVVSMKDDWKTIFPPEKKWREQMEGGIHPDSTNE